MWDFGAILGKMERCEIGRKIITLGIVSLKLNEGRIFFWQRGKATPSSNGKCNFLFVGMHTNILAGDRLAHSNHCPQPGISNQIHVLYP